MKEVGYFAFQDSEIFMMYEILPETNCPGPMLGRIYGKELAEILGQMTVAEVKEVMTCLLSVLVDPTR